MTDWISPIDRARVPGNVLDNIAQIKALVQGLQGTNVQAQNLAEMTTDIFAVNTSFPSICQGRLTLTSGNPTSPNATNATTIYFTPYIGNLIGMYNGSSNTWRQLVFSELSLPIQQSQSGGTHNGTAVIDGLTDTSQLVVGMWVSGTGVPTNAAILSIDSATQITMTVNSTASATVTITFKVPWSTDIDIFIMDTGNGALALRMVLWNARNESTITAITNASPMVVTTGLATSVPSVSGRTIAIRNVLGATGANGVWRIGTVTATQITLLNFDGTNSAAGGVYTSGGNDIYVDKTGITRASAISLQDGIYVLTSDPTWRYLGTAHVDTNNEVDDSIVGHRNLWNYYNRLLRPMQVADATASWLATSANTWIPDHNDITNRLDFVVGLIENSVIAKKMVVVQNVNAAGFSGLNIDTATGAPSFFGQGQSANAASVRSTIYAGNVDLSYYAVGNVGYHFIQGMENGSSAANTAWIGNGQHLIEAYVWA